MKEQRPPELERASQAQQSEQLRSPTTSSAVSQLRQALSNLERDSQSLRRIASDLDSYVQEQEGRFSDLEQALNDTSLLYVASYQLHARDDPKQVIEHIRELLEQLVGAEAFAVYLSGPGGVASAVASRGLAAAELRPLRTTEGSLHAALINRGPLMIEQSPLPRGTLEAPIATVPLYLGERAVGAILVLKLFEHKASWAQVDQQLFQLLASHGAAALLAAYMYESNSDLLGTLAGLGESLK